MDVEAIKKVFPYGQLLPVEFQAGGMRASSGIELPEMGGKALRITSAWTPSKQRESCSRLKFLFLVDNGCLLHQLQYSNNSNFFFPFSLGLPFVLLVFLIEPVSCNFLLLFFLIGVLYGTLSSITR